MSQGSDVAPCAAVGGRIRVLRASAKVAIREGMDLRHRRGRGAAVTADLVSVGGDAPAGRCAGGPVACAAQTVSGLLPWGASSGVWVSMSEYARERWGFTELVGK